MILIARKISRMGVVTLHVHEGRYYVRLRNRSNDTTVEISRKHVQAWKDELA